MVVCEKMTQEEKQDLIARVQKLNAIGVTTRFKPELFHYKSFDDEEVDYLKLVLLLREFEYVKDDKLFNATDKQRVKKYKSNQRATVSRYDVSLLAFLLALRASSEKKIGVI